MKNYLKIIIILAPIMILSCKKKTNPSVQQGKFYFINNTAYDIKYPEILSMYNVMANKTTEVIRIQDSGAIVNETTYTNPIVLEPNLPFPFTIMIGSKCVIVDKTNLHNPIYMENYVSEKLNERTYKFTYTFTEADYNRAVTCP